MRVLAFATTLCLAVSFGASGCGEGSRDERAAGRPAPIMVTRSGGDDAAISAPQSLASRMVVKSATLVLESDDPVEAAARARSAVEEAGGFVVRSDVQPFNANANSVSLTLRVPSARFDSVLMELRKLGDVGSETISGKDVTEEFLDVQAQLRNHKALEARFLELLGQAGNLSETLEVERELARVRLEVDRIEGRSKFLRDQVDLSTIHFTANPTEALARSTPTLGREVSAALGDSGEIIALVVAGLIRFTAGMLPILILAAVVGFGLRAALRLRKARG